MNLSIIVPVYNEGKTLESVVIKLKEINYIETEIIIIDDCSTDDTPEIIKKLEVESYRHKENQGKGAAIHTGLKYATGDMILIQDADLEYNPEDIKLLVDEMVHGKQSVVYGTRFHKNQPHNISLNYYGNRFLSLATSIMFMRWITDMETGYKLFRREVIKDLKLRHKRFGFEPEVTGKILRRGYIIKEVPIRYNPRTKEEGKKITWKDGVKALWIIILEGFK